MLANCSTARPAVLDCSVLLAEAELLADMKRLRADAARLAKLCERITAAQPVLFDRLYPCSIDADHGRDIRDIVVSIKVAIGDLDATTPWW